MINRAGFTEGLTVIAIMWAIFIIDMLLPGYTFDQFGIHPRSLQGLLGILFSPFLHANIFHIISNTIPLLILPFLIGLAANRHSIMTIMFLGAVGSGIGTWLFSLGGKVVGASGVVFALIGFLFANAYFSPSLRSWLCAIASFALYGGALLSLLKVLPFISWAAHFWGLISGIGIAYFLKRSIKLN